jgi:hypothetical protein
MFVIDMFIKGGGGWGKCFSGDGIWYFLLQ